ncbi:terminase small subunit [Leuconostoc phage CHB]|uniref:Terminase small subunit n=1 Tax=Leuconostoc phage CHB TaxID=1897737 RepID=A0A219VHJ7_9CAUD|nr:terminase small subunit [Leuconostoc phage CHB]
MASGSNSTRRTTRGRHPVNKDTSMNSCVLRGFFFCVIISILMTRRVIDEMVL